MHDALDSEEFCTLMLRYRNQPGDQGALSGDFAAVKAYIREHAAELLGLTWTREKPTKVGAYWRWLLTEGSTPHLVDVVRMASSAPGTATHYWHFGGEHWFQLSASADALWYGPLLVPPRLDEKLAECVKGLLEVTDNERETLTKLAQQGPLNADALESELFYRLMMEYRCGQEDVKLPRVGAVINFIQGAMTLQSGTLSSAAFRLLLEAFRDEPEKTKLPERLQAIKTHLRLRVIRSEPAEFVDTTRPEEKSEAEKLRELIKDALSIIVKHPLAAKRILGLAFLPSGLDYRE